MPPEDDANLAEIQRLLRQATDLARAYGVERQAAEPDTFAPFTDTVSADGRVSSGGNAVRAIHSVGQVVTGGQWNSLSFNTILSQTMRPGSIQNMFSVADPTNFYCRRAGWYLCGMMARLNTTGWLGARRDRGGIVPQIEFFAEVWILASLERFVFAVPINLTDTDCVRFQCWPDVNATLQGQPAPDVKTDPQAFVVEL